MTPPPGRHWRHPPARLDELDAAGLIAWSPAGNPRKIRYASDAAGKLPQDIWLYKDPQRPAYPTQKNARLLERIIRASSNPDDAVLDCYAGSGTTLIAAARLGRRFIGMDNSPAAHQVITKRLRAAVSNGRPSKAYDHIHRHTVSPNRHSGASRNLCLPAPLQ